MYENLQEHLNETLAPSQMITITQADVARNFTSGDLVVKSPLPDEFGMSVGSEFSSPFDSGNINQKLSQLFALGNISQKPALRMKRMFSNPEKSEISFKMEFNAYYNAKTEVLLPVMILMTMAVGRRLTWEEGERKIANLVRKIAAASNVTAGAFGLSIDGAESFTPDTGDTRVGTTGDRLLELMTIVQGAPTAQIRFGDAMVLDDCFISSVSTSFRNVLDADGIPMKATCEVTALLEQPPINEDVISMFDYLENR